MVPAAGHKEIVAQLGAGKPGKAMDRVINEQRDETLQHPRCVFQIVRRHFARYTPEVVEQICGVPREQLVQIAELLCSHSGRERTTAICYAVGWTQHSIGVQYIRAAAILQLLLGNIGRPGGGIMALRGHASIQGSTDIPTLFNLLPGYLPMPHHLHAQDLEHVHPVAPRRQRMVERDAEVHRVAAQGVVRRRSDPREWLSVSPAAAAVRRSLAPGDDRADGRRRDRRATS